MRTLNLTDISTAETACEWCGQHYRYAEWVRACGCSASYRRFGWAFTADRQGVLVHTDAPNSRGPHHLLHVYQGLPFAIRRLHAGKTVVLANVYRDAFNEGKITSASWWWEFRIREDAQ